MEQDEKQFYIDIISSLAKKTIRMLVIALCIMGIVAGACVFLVYWKGLKSEQALISNNEKWLNFIEQYDFESYDYQQDGQGVNIIGSGNGVDYNGAESENP